MSEFFQIFCKFISLYIWYVYNEIGKTLLIKKGRNAPPTAPRRRALHNPTKKKMIACPAAEGSKASVTNLQHT
jgi:hypothetical protein